MFGILEAAIAITAHREENGCTRPCSVAKKDIFHLLQVFSLSGGLKLSIHDFHITKWVLISSSLSFCCPFSLYTIIDPLTKTS